MINFTPRLELAIRRAAWAHEQQKQHRKGSDTPYVIHPFSVMIISSSVTNDEDTLIACLLHDILEDVDAKIYSKKNILEDFGENVESIVEGVTKDSSLDSWQDRADGYLDCIENRAPDESVIVCSSDKIHNLMSILREYKINGEDHWKNFNSNKEQQLWWYESVLTVVKKRGAPKELTDRLGELLILFQAT